MRAKVRSFRERNLVVIGGVGLALTAGLTLGALQYDKLPFVAGGDTYRAYFAEAGGLRKDADVQVSGYPVGKVSSVKLDGSQVAVTFTVADDVRLGDRTEAAIETNTVLGAKILAIAPRGEGRLDGPIPLARTTSPYELTDALGDLTQTVDQLDTDQLSDALATLAQTFQNTPPDLKAAVQGLTRFSQTLNKRDEQMRSLLTNANKTTSVLARRTDSVVGLIADTNALLVQLRSQSGALDQIAGNVSALSKQLSGFVGENRQQMRPALDKLNGVMAIVDNRKERIQKSLKLLNAYAMSLGESVSSGPFFNAYVANLLPGQFLQPFIDAAFSDLGLDPHTLLPSDRADPQTGQAASPALPVPYPRTGQGGSPNLTLPDAITGNPGDTRYPYREPIPPGPPGGPPPGPPAISPPEIASQPLAPSTSVYVPAPNEVPAGQGSAGSVGATGQVGQ